MTNYAETAELRRIWKPNLVRKSVDEGPVTDTSLQNDDELFRAIEHYRKYQVNGYLDAINAGATGGIQIALTIPAGATMSVGFMAGAIAGVLTTSGASGGTITLAAATRTPILLSGTLSVGATAGSLRVQWAEAVVDVVNGTTVKAGSMLELVELG